MSIVFQFRMLTDENDNFVRDYDVLSDTTLLDLHKFILDTLEYEECMASFFTADSHWEKLREFTPIDMGEEGENAAQPMDTVKLGQILHKYHDRLIYHFDLLNNRAYYLELTSAYEAQEGAYYPREIYAQADAPDQYDPSKGSAEGEGSLFDEVMGDFNSFEECGSSDDE